MTTLGWIVLVSLCCVLPLIFLALFFAVIKFGWKVITWPFRAIANLFNKRPAQTASTAPVQDDRTRNGAVTQTVTLNNSGAGGAIVAIIALVVVLAILALGAFLVFRPAAAPVAAAPQIVYVAAPTAVVPVVVPTASVPAVNAPVQQCRVIHDYQLKDLPEVSTSYGNFIHVEYYVEGQPEFETLLPGGRYTLNTQFPGGHVWEYTGCTQNEVMAQINAHITRRLEQKANNGGYQEWQSTGFFSPVQ